MSVDIWLGWWLAGAAVWIGGSTILAGQEGLPRGRSMLAFSVLILTVLLGAHTHSWLLEERQPLANMWARSPRGIFGPPYRLPGGLLLALLASPVAALAFGLPFRRLADCGAPVMGFGLAIGRLGCLALGCCFGRPSTLPWAVRFPAGSEAYWNHLDRGLLSPHAAMSLPVHPFPLYACAAGCAVSVSLFWLRRRRAYVGEVGVALVALQGLTMGTLEVFRETQMLPSVPLRQAGPLVVGTLAAVGFAWLRVRSRRDTRRAHKSRHRVGILEGTSS